MLAPVAECFQAPATKVLLDNEFVRVVFEKGAVKVGIKKDFGQLDWLELLYPFPEIVALGFAYKYQLLSEREMQLIINDIHVLTIMCILGDSTIPKAYKITWR